MRAREIVQLILGMSLYLLAISNSHAATVVLEDFQVVTQETISTTLFDVKQAGTYEVELVDFEFPTPFDILTLGIVQDLGGLAGGRHAHADVVLLVGRGGNGIDAGGMRQSLALGDQRRGRDLGHHEAGVHPAMGG